MKSWKKIFTKEEVYEALKQIALLKSQGPTDLVLAFFKNIGKSSMEQVCLILLISHLFSLFPSIVTPSYLLSLDPKVFIMYKQMVSKMLVNKIKPFMDLIISNLQSAFIPGRIIIDNIIVTHELLYSMNHNMKGKIGKIAVKLDMSKAYV